MGDGRMRTFRLRRVLEHGPSLKSFYFERPFDAEPGQFVNLWIPDAGEKPFSISNLTDGEIELTVKAIGGFTRRLMECRPGDWLGIRGPFGTGFTLEPGTLVVGGGVGIAPLRFLEKRLAKAGLAHTLVFGVRSRPELMFAEEYARAELSSDDGSVGRKGLVTARLDELLAAEGPRPICGAGPEPMLLAVKALAEKHHAPYQLSFERYMKCGVGLCGQCCLDGSGMRLCVEGPVLGSVQLSQVTELGLPHRDATGRRPPR